MKSRGQLAELVQLGVLDETSSNVCDSEVEGPILPPTTGPKDHVDDEINDEGFKLPEGYTSDPNLWKGRHRSREKKEIDEAANIKLIEAVKLGIWHLYSDTKVTRSKVFRKVADHLRLNGVRLEIDSEATNQAYTRWRTIKSAHTNYKDATNKTGGEPYFFRDINGLLSNNIKQFSSKCRLD